MKNTNNVNPKSEKLTYDERTGLLSKTFKNDTTLSFLFGGSGDYVVKKSIPYLEFPRMKEFNKSCFCGTMYVDGIIEDVGLEILSYDEIWGGYEVELITPYGTTKKRIKKHDISILSCLARSYETLIINGRRKLIEEYNKRNVA